MRGVSLIAVNRQTDSRGSFTKILKYSDLGSVPEFKLEEVFSSYSERGTIRGMHLQVGDASNWRIIQVLNGSAFDVLLDLRPSEPTYLATQINLLDDKSPQTLVVPPGVAHGFQALANTEMLYLSSHHYVRALDTGVNPLSIGIEWPQKVTNISERDLSLPGIENFA